MPTVTIEEAQAQLPQLIDMLKPGEEVVITQDNQPVAQLVPLPPPTPKSHFGICKGMLIIVAEDDEQLADFRETCRKTEGTAFPGGKTHAHRKH